MSSNAFTAPRMLTTGSLPGWVWGYLSAVELSSSTAGAFMSAADLDQAAHSRSSCQLHQRWRKFMPDKPILIIDDDPAIRATVAEILESEGYNVATATNG